MTPLTADIILAVIGLLAVLGVIWFVRETGDPANRGKVAPPKTRRQELVEAQQRIERQIEILKSPAGRGSLQVAPPPCTEELAELEQVLSGIKRELDAGPHPVDHRRSR